MTMLGFREIVAYERQTRFYSRRWYFISVVCTGSGVELKERGTVVGHLDKGHDLFGLRVAG